MKQLIKERSNIHRPSGAPNIFLFTVPRSGSTWLMELLLSQPGFKVCNEPLDLRNRHVSAHIGIPDWVALYNDESQHLLYQYFEKFINGRLRFKNQSPFRPFYRPFTRRIIFKILHGGEDRINWFVESFNGRVIYLLRHPIPVALSREFLPRLHAFVTSDYRRHFTPNQLAEAARIIGSGTRLQKGILSWCLQNSVPLRQRRDDWTILTYEQLVLDPKPIIDALIRRLDVHKPDRMWARLAIPSGTTDKSDADTVSALNQPRTTQNKEWLVQKWRERVSPAKETELMALLDRFEIDAYQAGSFHPASWLWMQKRPLS